jgi:hypothetical protein
VNSFNLNLPLTLKIKRASFTTRKRTVLGCFSTIHGSHSMSCITTDCHCKPGIRKMHTSVRMMVSKQKPFNLTLTPSPSNKREIPNKFDYLNIYIHAFIIYHFRQKTVTKNTFLYTNLLCFSKNIAESIKLRKKYVYFSRSICHRTKKINRIELQHMH